MDAWEAVGAVGSVAAASVAAWAAHQSRSSSTAANKAASTMAQIERERRHSELCPRFRVSCAPLGTGNVEYYGRFDLRVFLVGPPALLQLDKLTVTIRDDWHRRGDWARLTIDPNSEEIKRQIWGSYRFTPGTGPDDASADSTGRETIYEAALPVGETLLYQMEANPPPPWAKQMPLEQWQQQQGTLLRVLFIGERAGFDPWRLACELDVGSSGETVTIEVPERGPACC